MKIKLIILYIMIALLMTGFSPIINGNIGNNQLINNDLTTIYVDDDFDSSTPGWGVTHFDKIQDGINAANSGDTVYVYNGGYQENIVIDEFISLVGEDQISTIIGGHYTGDVVRITADGASIQNFCIMNSGSNSDDAGIKVFRSCLWDGAIHHVIVQSNTIRNCEHGIILSCSYYIIINRNTIFNNRGDGIKTSESRDIKIQYNDISDCDTAVYIYNFNNRINITENDLYENDNYGVITYFSFFIDIHKNRIYLNEDHGIIFSDGTTRSNITHNEIYSNNMHGVNIKSVQHTTEKNQVYNNTIISNSNCGIYLFRTENNIIFNNNISDNDYCGIDLLGSDDNIIYNNLFINLLNAKDDGFNVWSTSPVTATNIVGGPKIGGNYWSDYIGIDNNFDGFGDTNIPHNCNNNIDNGGDKYPLIFIYFPCSFTGPLNGKAGQEYTYTIDANDPYGGNVYYYIDWGDGTFEDWFGPFPSGQQTSVTHKWDIRGIYSISAKAKNEHGMESKWTTLEVSMPKNKPYINTPFLNFLQQYPILYQLLQRFFKL